MILRNFTFEMSAITDISTINCRVYFILAPPCRSMRGYLAHEQTIRQHLTVDLEYDVSHPFAGTHHIQ